MLETFLVQGLGFRVQGSHKSSAQSSPRFLAWTLEFSWLAVEKCLV